MSNAEKLLIVDDDPSMRMALYESLSSCGYDVVTAENGIDALEKFRQGLFAGVVTDMRMPKMTGMDVLKGVKKISPQTPVILITAYGTVSTAVEAMKEGASEFIMKPFSLDDLEFAVKNVLAAGAQKTEQGEEDIQGPGCSHKELITQDKKMLEILDMLKSVAKSKSSILIQGESGTGKELFARFVYRHSNRRQMPFVAVNCAAIPAQLLESEMFGYEKGAFTGAAVKKIGKFELADGGTLLLDEISEMDIQLQAKLLRVIQESEVDRLGGKMPVPVNVRIIATSNADLQNRILQKTFRSDLYYRLNVIPVLVPPLRSRNGDILLLAEHFIKKYSEVNEKKEPILTTEAKEALMTYSWPGNVRELENVMERAVLICQEGRITTPNLFLEKIEAVSSVQRMQGEQDEKPRQENDNEKNTTLYEMEKSMIFDTLNKVGWNKTKASKILGISVRTMRNKLNEYGIKDLAPDD
ncbi:MAG TPA: sigma-54 dependent transcriptional regulator [Smithellaceae bacterium]|nr:sigma-54 dependent transcriptional regulator [Smithellaceae bacterium]HQM45109.1 sigma-54 dependent transcriptional regulator [Smithellaceae bacterium]